MPTPSLFPKYMRTKSGLTLTSGVTLKLVEQDALVITPSNIISIKEQDSMSATEVDLSVLSEPEAVVIRGVD